MKLPDQYRLVVSGLIQPISMLSAVNVACWQGLYRNRLSASMSLSDQPVVGLCSFS